MESAELETAIAGTSGVLFAALFAYVLVEALLLHFWRHRFRAREMRMVLLSLLTTGGVAATLTRVIGLIGIAEFAGLGARLAPFELGLSFGAWIHAWIVYEFWYWVMHWSGHKVRLVWCTHSAHHAPGAINMAVGTHHHVLESLLVFPFFFGFMTALCGVHPILAVGFNVIDGLWGSFLHISDEVVPNGRYGFLEKFMQTPSFHRVHHGKNARYLDRNYNSVTLLWDWVFGTLEPLRDDESAVYGITRECDTGSFFDVHFREFVLLWRDVRDADGWGDRLRYLVKPPGWSPDGSTRTAAQQKIDAGLDERRGLPGLLGAI